MKTIIVTGGLGFIGSNLIELLLKKNFYVINLDKIAYSSNFYNTKKVRVFVKNTSRIEKNDKRRDAWVYTFNFLKTWVVMLVTHVTRVFPKLFRRRKLDVRAPSQCRSGYNLYICQ